MPVVLVAAVSGVTSAWSKDASAEPLRLRGDALVQTRSPVGLVMLRGEDGQKPWLDAETVAWVGATDAREPSSAPTVIGDVLSLSVRMRDAKSGSEVRAGRMIVTTGAVRPLHLDGARALGRVFGSTTLEAFGGFPVARRFDYRAFEWAAGGRLGQAISDRAAFGASYLRRASDGRRADEEAGVDLALTPSPWLTASARSAFDLVTYGVTDALASVGVQKKDARLELFTTHRSPGRLLPSTSLFSVLGDFAATSVGTTGRYRAFPRLELLATVTGQVQGGDAGGQGLARATLALDDDWAGTLGAEIRRVDFGASEWTGARVTLALPLRGGLRAATELELVLPDEPRGREVAWPWALGALGWRSESGWEAAVGVEASSGPRRGFETHALARLSFTFDRGLGAR